MNHKISLLLVVLIAALLSATGCSTTPASEVEATAAVHSDDVPVATPVASTSPEQSVTGEAVVYGRIDDIELSGYLARPADGGENLPGVIVIHEWWGLNDNIRSTAERLAGEGYVALAVDLYNGAAATTPKGAMQLMSGLMADQAQADENLRTAFHYLKNVAGAPKVGSIGWCLGGRWSLRTAVILPDKLDAAVMYYGTVTTEEADLAPLNVPVLGNFASDDPLIPQASVDKFESEMKRLGKDVDIMVFENTKHAFSNPSGLAYNPDAAAKAWARSTKFLAAKLQ